MKIVRKYKLFLLLVLCLLFSLFYYFVYVHEVNYILDEGVKGVIRERESYGVPIDIEYDIANIKGVVE